MSPECNDGSRSWRVYRAAGRPARFGVCDDARTSAASLVKSGLGRTRIMAKVKHPPAPCEMGEETARLRALPWQEKEKGRDERPTDQSRSEEHTSELQSLMRISYAVFCLKKKKKTNNITDQH